MTGDNTGVVRGLEEEELLDEDGRLFAGASELKDEIRDAEEKDRDDGERDASDVAGLTPRCAML